MSIGMSMMVAIGMNTRVAIDTSMRMAMSISIGMSRGRARSTGRDRRLKKAGKGGLAEGVVVITRAHPLNIEEGDNLC